MSDLLQSPYFGVALTAAAYCVGVKIQSKLRSPLCNPVIISMALIISVLVVFDIPYASYYVGGSLINMLLVPATACLGVSIYGKWALLKRSWLPVLAGCAAGVTVSVGSVAGLCYLFGLDRAMVMSLLPKSVTTPIAAAVAESHGGIVSVAVAAVMVTGILGNLAAPLLIRLFRVKDPVAAGLGIGACSHALGTAKAMELGETEGAMSGLAMGLCGILTVLAALLLDFF
ncbi:MAG: LrgB family protein [Oscillibacter sp.]